jgi:hypothetical protein
MRSVVACCLLLLSCAKASAPEPSPAADVAVDQGDAPAVLPADATTATDAPADATGV